jgi:hemolysin III
LSAPAATVDGVLAKPRMRGWIHQYCAVAAVVAGAPLVVVSWAEASKRAGHSTLTYALAIVAMFAVSAVYHRRCPGGPGTSCSRSSGVARSPESR